MGKGLAFLILLIFLMASSPIILDKHIWVHAQTNVETSISLTILSFGTSSNAVPVGTIANVELEINPAPPTMHDRFTSIALTVIEPNGVEKNITIVFGLGGNASGDLFTDLTSIVGTWTLKAAFYGQTFDSGVNYLPSENQTTYTVVPNTLPTQPYSPPLEITINADGSINPSNVSVERNDNTYSLTNNINARITVKRNDIIFDGKGYTLTYAEHGPGNIYALGIGASNNTIQNLTIIGGWYGLSLFQASNTTVVNNTILKTVPFMPPFNPSGAINVESGGSNIIHDNNFTNNYVGIRFFETNNNLVVRNTFKNSTSTGIVFWGSSNNTFYHNNFINNTQIYLGSFNSPSSGNVWDNGYPYGGNYWSDYQSKFPNTTEIDNSGIENTPYVIDTNNQDHYPLIHPFDNTAITPKSTVPEFPSLALQLFLFLVGSTSLLVYFKKHKHSIVNNLDYFSQENFCE